VTAAAPGDRINVCPGTYPEQVVIPLGKDNLRLISVERWKAVIKSPPGAVPDAGDFRISIVRVNGAKNTTILAFTITGPGVGPCGTLHYGVRVDNSGSANILGNHITHIRDEPFSGCQNGVAVGVGRQTPASAQIIGNVVDDYQKNGPTVNLAGSSAEIAYNRIFGHGSTAVTAQNGIQVGFGATASVRHNFVAGNVYSPQTFTATGILLYQSGAVNSEHNTVPSNDVGIDMFQTADGSRTTDNRVRASTFDGIAVDGTNWSSVGHNDVDHNAGPGIGMYIGAHNNTVNGNEAEDNADSGILLYEANNNLVASNRVRDNGTDDPADLTDGIRINSPSTGNTIRENRLKHNVTHDCHDGSAGNTWIDNRGATENRPGLCDGGEDQDPPDGMETSSAFGWNASYAWHADFPEAGGIDWVGAYDAFDTSSLLQLVPAIRVGVAHSATLSPDR
jgi:parallel beta-helix repeat protein